MVMHSNERGECDLRTLVDRQRKRLVDVVVRLHGPTDQAPKLRHLRVLAHVQLDDDPRTPIQQSVGEEFRQHDGVVTILMYYYCRASPKHYNDMIEVEYGGRGHRTRLRNDLKDQLVSLGSPSPQYIKDGGGGGRPRRGAPGGSPTPTRSRTPFFPSWRRRRGEGGGRGQGKGERRPPLLVLFGLGGRGAWPSPGHLSSLPLRPTKAHIPPGGFR